MKNQKIVKFISGFVFVAILIISCEKSKIYETMSLDNEAIRSLSRATGEAHNILIEKAANVIDIKKSTSDQYRNAILSIRLSNFSLNVPKSDVLFDKVGLIDPKKYVENHFKQLNAKTKNYLIDIFLLAKEGFSLNTFKKIDLNLVRLLDDKELTDSEKVLLSGTLEICRNSLIYWNDARKNNQNPYHTFFSNTIKSYSTPMVPFDCTTMIDMSMYAISFQDNYYNNALPLEISNQIALIDAAYQSGLASMAGGACFQ
ncbi:hypothetical protein [Sediminibacterium sp.]|uniref:hypothetical protein n=1 Tax=Sediminibacterium sp. TaxID=1917865 RepID=UPI0027309BF3|nr:hypothetical protein [Sediminibacterium sp.]MDP1973558.1 hypothetical protein [Sediminibacterium sp.]MDP2422491.1 hypothetical protein [Sediminibacterium sp.]